MSIMYGHQMSIVCRWSVDLIVGLHWVDEVWIWLWSVVSWSSDCLHCDIHSFNYEVLRQWIRVEKKAKAIKLKHMSFMVEMYCLRLGQHWFNIWFEYCPTLVQYSLHEYCLLDGDMLCCLHSIFWKKIITDAIELDKDKDKDNFNYSCGFAP